MRVTACLLAALGLLAALPAFAQRAEMDPAERAAMDRGTVQFLLKTLEADDVQIHRRRCAVGKAQEVTDKSRALGSLTLLDAADECPVVLLRQGRDGNLLQLYREVMVDMVGQAAGHEGLPASIAAAVAQGARQVAMGNRSSGTISPALAFDAGFTVAYRGREPLDARMPDPARLRPLVDRCLKQQEPDLKACFGAGVTLGARAVNGRSVTAL